MKTMPILKTPMQIQLIMTLTMQEIATAANISGLLVADIELRYNTLLDSVILYQSSVIPWDALLGSLSKKETPELYSVANNVGLLITGKFYYNGQTKFAYPTVIFWAVKNASIRF